jgi:two-component SAPR family response regulator
MKNEFKVPFRAIIISEDNREINHFKEVVSTIGSLTVESTFNSAVYSLNYINEHSVDIVVIDLQISSDTCFNLLSVMLRLKRPLPFLIFLTRRIPHNVDFIVNAGFDYLIKPTEKYCLIELVKKFSNNGRNFNTYEKIESLLQYVNFNEN